MGPQLRTIVRIHRRESELKGISQSVAFDELTSGARAGRERRGEGPFLSASDHLAVSARRSNSHG